MQKKIFPFIILFLLFNDIFSQLPSPKGLWKFDDVNNPIKAETGNDLELVGTHQFVTGPSESNNAVEIVVGSYYKMQHGIQPSLGNFVNEYSLQIDFMIPSYSNWHCFFQTNPANNNDGDCFINTSGKIGVGATGYSYYSLRPNEWYRLVISVKNGSQFKYYLDGQLLLNATPQDIDGRFSLDPTLLMFADEDGEDGVIKCAELAIWDKALSNSEVTSLGGFGHQIIAPPTRQLVLVPYLQEPTMNSVYICWHDTLSTFTKVEYGTTSALGQIATGSSEIIKTSYRWHSVKLSGLQPNTEYYYKAISGSGSSEIYSFKTFPDNSYKGKIRFLLLSDTHSSDTTMAVKVIKEAKEKMQQLYGNDIQNQINFVLHSGDLVVDGSNIIQWTDQYFAPMSPISPNISFMTITGNHEGEHENYYKYMHYDDVSPFPAANEKFWSFRIANTLVIGLNSNAISSIGVLQKTWLEQIILPQAEADSTIDFVFVISHHFAITELWGEGMTFEVERPTYIRDQIYPVLKKYSKVVQHSYGHTHGFERGTIESNATNSRGDFRIVCGGGGGGATDRWGVYKNTDFPNIYIAFDNYFFQLIEIDVANKIFESSMYSLGNSSKIRNTELMDKWYKKVKQNPPADPISSSPTIDTSKITFQTSEISGDSLMSVKIQVADNENFTFAIIDTVIHWKNVYGVDENYNPVDLNKGLDLTKLSFDRKRFESGKSYFYRVKYRDHNLKWSNWSNITSFDLVTNVSDTTVPYDFQLLQNYPNPFNPSTTISFTIPSSTEYYSVLQNVTLKVYDILGREVATLVNENKQPGFYHYTFSTLHYTLPSGVYFYTLKSGQFSETKKMILLR